MKQKIVQYLGDNGFSLPVRIAKAIELEPVFTSAILSELVNSQKIKTTHFRLGASCFYYLEGQEDGLEAIGNEYLKGVEKEAFSLLKQTKILKDINQLPAIRVALRSLKDFAIPFKYEDEICWRYSLISKNEIQKQIDGENVEKEIVKEEAVNEEEKQTKREMNNSGVKADIIEEKEDVTLESFESPFKEEDDTDNSSSTNKKNEKTVFLEEVKDFLKGKGLKLYEVVDDSRNEIVGKVKVNSDFGEIVFLVVARNKKSLNDADVLLANSKAVEFKSPLFLLGKGNPNKKAQAVIDEYLNLIKFESMVS